MTRRSPRTAARVAPAVALVVSLTVALTGCGTAAPGSGTASPATGAATDTAASTPSGEVPPLPDPVAPAPVPEIAMTGALAAAPAGAAPTLLELPALGLARVPIPLGLDAAGALEVPADAADVGWYVHSAEPGAPGPAVVAGHVDSRDGPGVFWRLREVQPGDEVRLARADGRVAVFRVDRVEQHPKDAFPTGAVYGPTSGAELRLITCGGEFDRASSHYRDNVVVFASLERLA